MDRNTKRISPTVTTLDAGNAYWMARLAKAVYMKADNSTRPDEEGILQELKQDDDGFLAVTGFDNKSSQAALVEHNAYICMAFRGTDELTDWLDNIDVVSTEQFFGDFHRGFWESVEDIWQPMLEKYEALQGENNRPLFITGHSLGGAMATVAAAKLLHEDKPVSCVYTFGQPRTMKQDASRVFNSTCKTKFFRFHNNNDIVTRIPAWLAGYRHVGTCLYISRHRVIYRKVSWLFDITDHIYGILGNLAHIGDRGLDTVGDHDKDEYLKAILEWNMK